MKQMTLVLGNYIRQNKYTVVVIQFFFVFINTFVTFSFPDWGAFERGIYLIPNLVWFLILNVCLVKSQVMKHIASVLLTLSIAGLVYGVIFWGKYTALLAALLIIPVFVLNYLVLMGQLRRAQKYTS